MDAKIFEAFCKIIYDKSGITLAAGKESLVGARIGKRMRVLGITNDREYLTIVQKDTTGEEIVQLLDVISTNVTSFFREPAHFDFMRERITEWQNGGQKRFRFWSAACSSGEEPYSMAMLITETLGANTDMKILATDISTKILDKSTKGIYEAQKVEPIPRDLLTRYFAKVEGGKYQVKPNIRDLVMFKRMNLSTPPFPLKGPMDIVFCRNVMIYFDNAVRTRLVRDIARLLRPGGFLCIGHSESLTGLDVGLTTVSPAVYAKK